MSYTPSVTATERYATVDVVGQRFTYPVSTSTIADVAAPIKGNNLLKASNNISDSSWTKTRASPGATVDVTLDDGTEVTLTKLVENGTAASQHYTEQAAVGGDPTKPAVYQCLLMTSGNSRRLQLQLYGDTSSNYCQAAFNPDTGAVGSVANTGTATGAAGTIVAVGSYLGSTIYRITLKGTASSGADTTFDKARLMLDNGTTSGYDGDTTSGVYIGQMQLTEGTEATTYNETTTERISGDGQRLTHSGDLANAAWTKQNVTGVSAGAIAYTNAATLDTGEVLSMAGMYETVTSIQHYITQDTNVPANAPAIGSIIAKGISRDYVRILFLNISSTGDHVAAIYRFSTGVITLANTGTGSGAALVATPLGDGAVKLTLSGTPSTAAGNIRLQIYSVGDTGATSFAGDTSKGMYWAEPIIVPGTVAPSYTRSYADRLAAGGSTRDRAYVLIPHIDEFDAAGDHIGTRWNTEQTWAVTDGTTTATSTESFAPPDAANFGTAGLGPYVYAPDGTSPDDEAYIHVKSGTGVSDTEDFSYSALTSSVVRFMAYDMGTFQWLPYNEETFSVEGGTATGLGAVGVVKASLRRGMI